MSNIHQSLTAKYMEESENKEIIYFKLILILLHTPHWLFKSELHQIKSLYIQYFKIFQKNAENGDARY